MTCKDYSLMWGLDANCLNVYRQKRGIPKKTIPLKIYEAYKDEKKQEDDLLIELQNAYYILLEKELVFDFGVYLENIKLISNRNSIYDFFNRCFASHDRIIGKYYTDKRKKVLDAYKEYVKWICTIVDLQIQFKIWWTA